MTKQDYKNMYGKWVTEKEIDEAMGLFDCHEKIKIYLDYLADVYIFIKGGVDEAKRLDR